MKTKENVYGRREVERVMTAGLCFNRAALGTWRKVRNSLAQDHRLVNAQYWYRFPIHMVPCSRGSKDRNCCSQKRPTQAIALTLTIHGTSCLLNAAREPSVITKLNQSFKRTMRNRFNYSPRFSNALMAAKSFARDWRKNRAVLKRSHEHAKDIDATGQ
jgi:hypothetical protein